MPTGPEWNVLPLARDITIAVNASIQLTGLPDVGSKDLESMGRHRENIGYVCKRQDNLIQWVRD